MSSQERKPNKKVLESARKYYIKLTRKLPGSEKRTYKSEQQLAKEIATRKKNFAEDGPKCFKPTIAITEEKKHNGKACKNGEERTTNYCIKELNKYDKEKTRWAFNC